MLSSSNMESLGNPMGLPGIIIQIEGSLPLKVEQLLDRHLICDRHNLLLKNKPGIPALIVGA